MIYLLLVLFFVVMSALFSGVETAFITANPLKVYGKVDDKKKVRHLMGLFSKMDLVINTILVGTNISVISAAVFFSMFFQKTQGYPFGKAMLYSSSILTIFMLIFSEILPKAFCLKHANKIVQKFTFFLRFFMVLFWPLSEGLKILNRLLLGKKKDQSFISREEVEFLFYDGEKTEKEEDEKDFIYRVLNLSDFKAREAMIPLNRIAAVPLGASSCEIMEKLKAHYFSRLPVYEGEIFNLIGYVPTRKFLFHKEKSVSELLKETLFFPETKALDEALFEMQKAKKPLCFVVDEHGAVSGILTKEDMAEMIVGNIEDEIHLEENIISVKGGILVPGSESIEFLNKNYKLNIEKEGFETLSGFACFKLRKIPFEGESFTYKGFSYEILEVESRVVKKLKITGGHLK